MVLRNVCQHSACLPLDVELFHEVSAAYLDGRNVAELHAVENLGIVVLLDEGAVPLLVTRGLRSIIHRSRTTLRLETRMLGTTNQIECVVREQLLERSCEHLRRLHFQHRQNVL